MGNVLILNYHEIIDDTSELTKRKKNKLSIKKSEFIKQLNLIINKGIPIVSLQDWINKKIQADFAVVLTFDEAYQSDFSIALPILKEKGLTATFFSVLSFMDKENKLSWDQLKKIHKAGFTIGSNSVLHKNMRLIGKDGCKFELELSKRIIEQKINSKIELFAVPHDQYNRKLLQLAFYAGYRHVLSSHVKINKSNSNFVLHRSNIKKNTSIEMLEKLLIKGLSLQQENSMSSKIKSQLSLSFGIGFIQKVNALFLKKVNK